MQLSTKLLCWKCPKKIGSVVRFGFMERWRTWKARVSLTCVWSNSCNLSCFYEPVFFFKVTTTPPKKKKKKKKDLNCSVSIVFLHLAPTLSEDEDDDAVHDNTLAWDDSSIHVATGGTPITGSFVPAIGGPFSALTPSMWPQDLLSRIQQVIVSHYCNCNCNCNFPLKQKIWFLLN